MAAITVSHTAPTLLAEGGEGTAANPTQVTIRFADSVTGTINVINAAEYADAVDPAAEGYPWPDTEAFSATLVAGQKLYGQAVSADKEVRVLVVNP